MRNISDIQSEPGLMKFADSPSGTLYVICDTLGIPRIMVRHFDSALPSTCVKPFADFGEAAQEWIKNHPNLARLVRITEPIEIGLDFIARPYYMYSTSTDAYIYWEYPPEPPEELEQMHNAFRSAISQSKSPKDALIEKVLARSLVEPTGKTFFDEEEGKFIIVELKLTREDLERWITLSDSLNS